MRSATIPHEVRLAGLLSSRQSNGGREPMSGGRARSFRLGDRLGYDTNHDTKFSAGRVVWCEQAWGRIPIVALHNRLVADCGLI
jgi:hypothetical protein